MIILLGGAILILFIVLYSTNNYVPNLRNIYAGNVYDINGKPIDGVTISFKCDEKVFARVQSDDNGKFTLRTNQNNIDTLSAQKEGYLFRYDGIVLKQPYNFLGWIDKGERSIKVFNKVKEKPVNPNAELLLGKFMRLEINSDVSDVSWNLELSIENENGGLVNSSDEYAIKAPLGTKYQQHLIFESSSGEPRSSAAKLVYFKVFNNGMEKYGWLRFLFKPYSSNGPMFYLIDWGINNSGRRELLHPSDGFSNLFMEMVKDAKVSRGLL